MVTCTRDDVHRVLETEAKKCDPARGSLVCLSLRLHVSGAQGKDFKAQVERETRTILTGNTRTSDSLLRLEGTPYYAVLLREVDVGDAQRLCQRLAGLLEEVDLAGEITVKVDSHVSTLTPDQSPQTFAREAVAGLTARR
ncbi:MAG: hypothetical protein HY815_13435 [Candidatus Riflebacteria bacterium]|nr:hypothetical protein [Candidatus Riflebacteria bacterium]